MPVTVRYTLLLFFCFSAGAKTPQADDRQSLRAKKVGKAVKAESRAGGKKSAASSAKKPLSRKLASSKNNNASSRSKPARTISSTEVKNQIRQELDSLQIICRSNGMSNQEKLAFFVKKLDTLTQYAEGLKTDYDLSLLDLRLINGFLYQARELKYKQTFQEKGRSSLEKAHILRSRFDHNYRYSRNLNELQGQEVFVWWAKVIVQSLSCFSDEKNKN